MNVANMLGIIASIPDPMILESLLPNLHVRTKFLPSPKRKAAFDELNRLLQACQRRNQNMDVVGHDGEFMQEIGGRPIVIERVDQKFRPRLGLEKSATFPCGRGDHVGLGIVRRMFSLRLHSCSWQSLSG